MDPEKEISKSLRVFGNNKCSSRKVKTAGEIGLIKLI